MKKFILLPMFILVFYANMCIHAQDISFIPQEIFLYDTLDSEIIFDIEVTNLSAEDQTVFIVRTINNLPSTWTSSLCFDLCFSPEVDSIATTSDFGSNPLTPGETRTVSLHVFTDDTIGTANVQLQAGTFRHPDDRITEDFIATTDPSVSVRETNVLNSYYLYQNYPNPFNPTTRINYNVGEPGLVQLKVYNVLGIEVATLVNEQQYSGDYLIDFNASNLSSGVYFYSLSVNNFTQTRKMILEK